MTQRLLLLLLLWTLGSGSAAAEVGAGLETATTLARIEEAAAGITSLASDFVQEKHLEMFQEVLVSRGRFYFQRPDRLRWEMTEPVASGFSLNGGHGKRWHDLTGRSDSFETSREPAMKLIAAQLLAWARTDFVWLKEQYRIAVVESAPVVLRLEPRDPGAKGYVDHLQISFADDASHIRIVEMIEADGDSTVIRFINTEVNGDLPGDLF